MTQTNPPNKTAREHIAETFIPTERVAAVLAPNVLSIARDLRDIAQDTVKAHELQVTEEQQ